MQTIRHESFMERMLYYSARLYGGTLKKGEGYESLRSVYSLVFADFRLFPEQKPRRPVSSFSVREDRPPHFLLSDHLWMVFVDLTRFEAENGLYLIQGLTWCYTIKKACRLSSSGWI